jgi:iron(III) transport system ATP-binding protein
MSATATLSLPIADAPAGRAAALAVGGLRRSYGTTVAVDDVSWQAAAGEVICLLGHSGCGKTTLLRLIAGLEAPDAGRVEIDGEALSAPGVFVPPERRRIGLVFQDYALFPHLSVLANVLFGLRDASRGERESRALTALRRVGLQHKARAYPHTLSGGEQQRVALARALAPQPRLLLLDEPFSNLDRRLRDQVRDDTLRLLRASGTTAVVVTHDPEEALRIADRIVLMHRGRVEQQGRPQDLYQHPASLFAARFFCELNEIPGHCRDGKIDTPLGCFAANGVGDGAARLCLRPQDIAIDPAGTGPLATVIDALFLGDAEQLNLRVAGLEQPLRLRTRVAVGARAGATLQLSVAADAALVFPE